MYRGCIFLWEDSGFSLPSRIGESVLAQCMRSLGFGFLQGVEGGEEKATPQIQAPAAATENGKSAADAHEPASDKADNVESVEKVAPLNDETRAQAGEEVKVGAGNGVDPSAIVSQLVDEAAAAQVEADKVGSMLVYRLDAYRNVIDILEFV